MATYEFVLDGDALVFVPHLKYSSRPLAMALALKFTKGPL